MTGTAPAQSQLNAALSGRYTIERELGAGGMATVFLAHDVRHDRKVALKVLKPELSAVLGGDRFVVEIKTTAALQHPHILPLFDSGTADGLLFYVMPYIQGETIREKLNRETQFSVEEAVRITLEVADALDYAHRHGVIHRDIKPENILLHDGRAMVMDFGIALAVSAAAGGRMTETGLSLGTPHYMSPEQATAEKDLTPRSDVYSLASVLYEMLTGEPPHTGGSAQAVIMKIITDTARPVEQLRRSVPPNVAAAVSKALEKLPADRFDSAKAFRDALASREFTHEMPLRTTAAPARGARPRTEWLPWAVAGVLAIVAVLGWLRRQPAPPLARLDLGTGAVFATPRDVVISPDGSLLAVAGILNSERAIFIRRLDGDAEFRKLPGTEDGGFPAFSPDNQWIVFRTMTARTLVKVAVAGGGAITLVPAGTIDPYSPHWGTATHIVFSSPQGNFRMAASGGQPERLAKVTGRTPFLLPDGSGVLFTAPGGVALYEFAGDTTYNVGVRGSHASLVAPRYLVYVNETGGLSASRFDRKTHVVSGAPVGIADRVGATLNSRGYSVSGNGTLVLHDAVGASLTTGFNNRLLLVTPGGPTDTLRLPPGRRTLPRFSPNGRLLVFEQAVENRAGQTDLYTFDLVTGTTTQLTFGGDNDDPVWSPDGSRILFNKRGDVRGETQSPEAGPASGEDLYLKAAADNSAPEQRVLALPGGQWPNAWLKGDQVVLTSQVGGQQDLLLWTLNGSAPPKPYLNAPWNEADLQVSPDGKLAAFVSNERGTSEIWMRDFPVPQGKWRLSSGSSQAPRWSPDGRYVYFTHAGGGLGIDTVYRVRIDRSPSITVRAQEVIHIGDIDGIPNWDLHPDGKRFVISSPNVVWPTSGANAPEARFLITLNWVAQLERMMAAAGR